MEIVTVIRVNVLLSRADCIRYAIAKKEDELKEAVFEKKKI